MEPIAVTAIGGEPVLSGTGIHAFIYARVMTFVVVEEAIPESWMSGMSFQRLGSLCVHCENDSWRGIWMIL